MAESEAYLTKEDCLEAIGLWKKTVAQARVESRIEEANYFMSTLKAEEPSLKVGQPVALGTEIIARKNRDGTIVLYEVVE